MSNHTLKPNFLGNATGVAAMRRWSGVAVALVLLMTFTSTPVGAGVLPEPSPSPSPSPELDNDATGEDESEDTSERPDGPVDTVLPDPEILAEDLIAQDPNRGVLVDRPDGSVAPQSVEGQPIENIDYPNPEQADVYLFDDVTIPAASVQLLEVESQRDLKGATDGHELWTDLSADKRKQSKNERDEYDAIVGVGESTVADAFNEQHGGRIPAVSDSAGRPDLVRESLPRVAQGETVRVETLPGMHEDFIPGAAFALKVSVDDPSTSDAGWVDLALDVSGLHYAFGGDFGDRMQLVVLPECALTEPENPDCLQGVPLTSHRDAEGMLRATVPADAGDGIRLDGAVGRFANSLSVGGAVRSADLVADVAAHQGLKFSSGSGGTIVAAVAGASGPGGTFTATDLSPAGSWAVAEQSGAFTYSIPLDVPPVTAGPVPSVALGYSSSTVDGHNIATNGQAGTIGDGWSLDSAFIERQYKPCKDDIAAGSSGLTGHADDLCWQSPYSRDPGNASFIISLDGISGPLVWDGGNRYYPEFDPDTRITHYTRSGNSFNGDNNSEYFMLQTQDGSAYYFGYGVNPTDGAATNSVATVPVFGDDSGEPRGSGQAANPTTQGYRFMLDVSLDSLDNAAVFTYKKFTNHYASNADPAKSLPYTRAIQIASVDYGMQLNVAGRESMSVSAPAEARVEFTHTRRCVEGTNFTNPLAGTPADCPTPNVSNAASYPDVPTDRACSGTCTSTQSSPTFYQIDRLSQINTFVRADEQWKPVATHQLIQAFPPTEYPETRALWLDSVFTRSYANYDVNDYLDTYAIRFDGTQLPNRVDWKADDAAKRSLDKRRIARVINEFGGVVEVDYSSKPDSANPCPTGGVDSSAYATWKAGFAPSSNTFDCYETKFGDEGKGIYHKYLVSGVELVDTVGDSPTQGFEYRYVGQPAWAYAESPLYALGEGDAGWSDWRGYQTVESSSGTGSQKSTTRNQYYRGMSKNFDGDGTGPIVNLTRLTDSAIVVDEPALKGYLAASQTLDDAGNVASESHSEYEVTSTQEVVGTPIVSPTVKEVLVPGDVNGDGNTDLLFWHDDNTLTLHHGDGAGGVTSAQGTAVPGNWDVASIVAPGDWNGNDNVDLLTIDGAGAMNFHSGDGSGAWGSGSFVSDGWDVYTNVLAPGDWDGDGKPDLLAMAPNGDVQLFAGTGSIALTPVDKGIVQSLYADETRFGNFSGEAATDMIRYTGSQWLIKPEGVGPWEHQATSIVPSANIIFADIDGDGIDDFVRHDGSQYTYAPDGKLGSWQTLFTSGVDISRMVVGDFNGDGDEDLAAHLTGGWRVRWSGRGSWVQLNTTTTDPATIRMGDFDGDGKTDMARRVSIGWQFLPGGTNNWQSLNSDTFSGATSVANFKGDTKDDIYRFDGTTWDVLHDGVGSWIPRNTTAGNPAQSPLPQPGEYEYTVGLDMNGDGKDDIVRVGPTGWSYLSGGLGEWTPLETGQWRVWEQAAAYGDFSGSSSPDILTLDASGTLWAQHGDTSKPYMTGDHNQIGHGFGGAVQVIAAGDWTGDSNPDVLTLQNDGRITVHAGSADGTTKATDTQPLYAFDWDASTPAGADAEFVRSTQSVSTEFDPDTHAPRVTTTQSTEYNEQNQVANATTVTTEGSENFTECAEYDYVWNTTNANGDPVSFFDSQGWAGSEYLVVSSGSRSYWGTCTEGTLTGRSETLFDGATDQEGNVPQVGLPTSERSWADGDTVIEARATYDARGRILTAQMPNDIGTTKKTQWAYARGADGVTAVTVTDVAGNESVSWSEPAHGNMVKEESVNGDFTHYQYDAFGLLTAGWGPEQHGLEAVPADTVVPTALIEYDIYAPGLAIRTAPVAVMSGELIGKNADGYFCEEAGCFVRRSYTFFDGFGRVREEHGVAPDGSGGRTVVATNYDDRGLVESSTAPFFNASAAQFSSGLVNPDLAALASTPGAAVKYVENTFDWAGRTVSAVSTANHADAPVRVSTTDFQGGKTLSTAPTGAVTEARFDALGRLASQYTHPESGYDLAEALKTSYAYDVLANGSRLTVTDPEGNDTVFVSDLAGTRTELTDPNSGTSTYTYDANGQTLTVGSEAGVLSMAYDDLGRMTSRTSVDADGVASSSAAWTFDPVGHIGALQSESATTVVDGVALTTVSSVDEYDVLHRPVVSTVTLPENPTLLGDLSGYSYTRGVEYDELGQVVGAVSPAAGGLMPETLRTEFNRFGVEIASSVERNGFGATVPLVEGVQVNAVGQLTQRSFAGGVSRSLGWDPFDGASLTAEVFYFDDTVNDFVHVQADEYHRDGSGRVTRVDDLVPRMPGTADEYAVSQCYSYDGFNRLDAAWTINPMDAQACGDGAPGASDSFWAVDGSGYAAAWSYSDAGRMLTQSVWSELEGVVSVATGQFGYDNAAHAHAVTSVTDGSDVNSFVYDAAGRMTQRTVDGVAMDLTWDALSNLVSTVEGGVAVSYVYDAGGQRVLRIAGTEVTAYFGDTELTDTDTGVNAVPGQDVNEMLDATRYYTSGGSTVAYQTDDRAMWFIFGDIQGSATVVMETGDPATAVVHRNAYTPYGTIRGDAGITDTERGWLGQTADTVTGLTYLNARYYDPAIGRFLSPDPLMDLSDPRTLDAYRYAESNPVSYIDASGLRITATDGSRSKEDKYWSTHKNLDVRTGTAKAPRTGYPKPEHQGHKSKKKRRSVNDAPLDDSYRPTMNGRVIDGNGGFNCVASTYALSSACTQQHVDEQPPVVGLTPRQEGVVLIVVGVIIMVVCLPAFGICSGGGAGVAGTGVAAYGGAEVAVARGVVARGVAANSGDHIVLGYAAQGLDATAANVGGRTLLADANWQATVTQAVANPGTRFTVALDGMPGTSVTNRIMASVQRSSTGKGGYTDWEMAQLYQGGRLPDVTFIEGGKVVPNPWAG
jgi:RHS repeat-associated protein